MGFHSDLVAFPWGFSGDFLMEFNYQKMGILMGNSFR
jgi:hypothetical protein